MNIPPAIHDNKPALEQNPVELVQCTGQGAESQVVYGSRTLAVSRPEISSFRGDKGNADCVDFSKMKAASRPQHNAQQHFGAAYQSLPAKSEVVMPRDTTARKLTPALHTNFSSLPGATAIPPPPAKPMTTVVDKPQNLPVQYGAQGYGGGSVSTPMSYGPVTSPGDHKGYAVLCGNSVIFKNREMDGQLPAYDKYMVKERMHNPATNRTRVKLVLKATRIEAGNEALHLTGPGQGAASSTHGATHGTQQELDSTTKAKFYPENAHRPGYIVFSRDQKFQGHIKYSLPNDKAKNQKIGKGGNGFVFTMYHELKEYAVKRTVYRPNEVNVHSALKHDNVLPLLAVLLGEKHEKHGGRFHCYHFMPKLDYDLRQVLSIKNVGSLKNYYAHCSPDPKVFEQGFKNIKFILGETLKALEFIHQSGYIHRDVKASNIMMIMQCRCKPLECDCSGKMKVKLGDFDSAGSIPGLGIKEPTDQMIKFASILPLGTPGYRAPEVSQHIVLSGPYETLYTTSVDMWAFGCLCMNIAIGKTAAIKQREEASLLLSRTHPCGAELWAKTTKVPELERTKPFSHDRSFTGLVRSCLQVDPKNRPTATQARQHL